MYVATKAPSSILLPHMSGVKPLYAPFIPKRPLDSFSSYGDLGRGPSLGSGPNFDSVTVFAAAAGVGAAIGTKFVEQPMKSLLTALGVASVGFAIYRAFFDTDVQASAAKPTAKPATVTDRSMPIANIPAYGKVSGSFSSPASGSVVKVERAFFSIEETYPATIVLSNASSEAVPFYYRVVATEKPSYLWGLDTQNQPNTGEVTQGLITLAPGDLSHQVNLVLKPLSSFFSDQADVTLTLQKKQAATAPWEAISNVTFILK